MYVSELDSLTTEVELFIKIVFAGKQITYFEFSSIRKLKKQRFGTIDLAILVIFQSVSTPATDIFKDSLGIHSTLTSLLQVT